MKKIYCLVLFIMIVNFTLWAQQSPYEIPEIIPPSANAQAFMRYGEIPVDYSTGVPNIEIPIYTVEEKKIKIPISISYHASGIKVNDVASEVGLGWVLNAGGIVSRTVFGAKDELINGQRYFKTARQLRDTLNAVGDYYDKSSNCYPKIRWFEEYMLNSFPNEDPISDRFFYKLPGSASGVFRCSYLSDSIITLPYRPLKIQKIVSNAPLKPEISEIKITDENGTIHTFHLLYSDYAGSEWYLKEMVSVDGVDTVKFEYEVPAERHGFMLRTEIYNKSIDGGIFSGNTCKPNVDIFPFIEYSGGSSINVNTPLLLRIVSSNSIIKFTYDERIDDFGGKLKVKKLTNIAITNRGSEVVLKNFSFNHEYFGNSTEKNRRLCLESVAIKVHGMPLSEKYSFKYYKTKVLPPYSYYATSYNEDFWGYYNGSNSSNSIPADFVIDMNESSFGNRNPDVTGIYARACMLEEIEYPTGGRTVFNFERNFVPNVYLYKFPASMDGYIGGFRVDSITNFNELNEIVGVKTYEYEGACFIPIMKSHFLQTHYYKVDVYCDIGSWGPGEISRVLYSRDKVYSDPVSSIEISPGLPVVYTKVTEYNGTKKNHVGKTVFEYNPPYSSSPSYYTIGQYEHPFEFEAPWHYHRYHYDKGNYVPEIKSQKIYSFNGTKYLPVSTTTYQYSKLFTRKFVTGIYVTRPLNFSTQNGLDPIPSFCLTPDIWEYISSFTAIDTKAYQEASLITETKKITYDQFDQSKYIEEKTNYSYNEQNLGIYEKTTRSSDNDLLKTSYKYPFDFCNSNNIYCKMVSRNIIQPVIEQIETSNSSHVSSAKTNYAYWKSNAAYQTQSSQLCIHDDQSTITPVYTDSKEIMINRPGVVYNYFSLSSEGGKGHLHLKITGPDKVYYANDNSTIEVSEPGTYKLDLSFIYPDGESNIGFYGECSVNYKSNEAIATSPLLYRSSSATDYIYPSSLDVKNGNSQYETKLNYNNYDLTGNVMSVSKQDDINVIYIWGYNNQYPVVKGENVDYSVLKAALESAAGTTNLETFWSSISNLTYTNTAFKNFNITLRKNSSLQGALVTIYTYDPLIGMTSQTDPNGITTYYEYDDFGRLKYIKDIDGNILKKYEYHYTDSTED